MLRYVAFFDTTDFGGSVPPPPSPPPAPPLAVLPNPPPAPRTTLAVFPVLSYPSRTAGECSLNVPSIQKHVVFISHFTHHLIEYY